MRALNNRIRHREDRFGLNAPTAEDRRLWERIEAGRRRLAESAGKVYVPRPFGSAIPDEIRGLALDENLHRGRLRASAERYQ